MSSTVEAQARARVGTLIKDRWHLDALLGLGGMAWVYSATHRNKNRVAIKLLIPQLSHSADITRRFLREGYAANSIAHPGAVTVFDDDVTEDGLAFLVMELLEGKTLAQLRRDAGGRLEPRVVLEHADKVLDILAAAHEHGVIHRDIKPSNVFITHDGTLKVLDFGIARICEAEQDLEATQTGMLLGSAPFMPPEQARGRWEMVDARTDLWSMGATMFQLLAGRAVHEASTPQERLLAAMSTHARSLGSLVPNMPQAVVRLVDRALRFDRDDRWQTAREMQSAVRNALTRMGSLGSTLVLGCPPPEISSPFVTPAPLSPPDEAELAPAAAVSVSADRPAASALGATRLGFALDPAADPARPAAAPRSLGETATYGSPLHAGLLPPIPPPKGLTSEAQDARPEAIHSPQLASFGAESAPAPATPVVGSNPVVIPVLPERASRPQVVEPPDASTAAAGAVTRDRPRSGRKQSGLMLAGVAAIVVGALLLALAGVGLWQMQRQARQVAQEQSALGAMAEPPAPSAAAPQAEPPSVDDPPAVAPLPSTSPSASDASPSAESSASIRGGAKPPQAIKKPKADTYR